jgi:hypothetical protein
MNKIEKIEEDIRRLSAEELAVLRTWLREYDSNAWDSKILVDASSGKLDSHR